MSTRPSGRSRALLPLLLVLSLSPLARAGIFDALDRWYDELLQSAAETYLDVVEGFNPPSLSVVSAVSPADAPLLRSGQKLKVMSWNIQYMAGKNYVFFYDTPSGEGATRPAREDIELTIERVAALILQEDPDVILLQEVDDGSRRTDSEDQLARLLACLGDRYPSHVSAFYHQSAFVPHPSILGSVGMKLSTLSKYRIASIGDLNDGQPCGIRHQLPIIPESALRQRFNFKRCILETRFETTCGGTVAMLNTHLDAFAQGSDTMERQVERLRLLLDRLTSAGIAWAVGGDFNLLPPGAYGSLAEEEQIYYTEQSPLDAFFYRYQAVPSVDEAQGPCRERWFTHFPNGGEGLDRTLDYLFLSQDVELGAHSVLQGELPLLTSDHLPVVAEITLP